MKRRLTFLLIILSALFVMPTLAQDSKAALATVSYQGVTFSYDPVLGAVLPQTVDEVAASDDALPGDYWPAHIAFSFIKGQEGDQMLAPDYYPQLIVYKVSDIAAYNNEFFTNAVQDLTKLAGTTDFSKYAAVESDDSSLDLPHLPPVAAGQVLRAQISTIDMSTGTGIRYLTAYSQDVSPMTDDRIQYTYQGTTSADGKSGYYIALTFPIKTGVLPTEIPTDFDYDIFSKNYFKEMNATIQKIDALDANVFDPTLTQLDDLVKSIKIEG
jgi:hypothetical protein